VRGVMREVSSLLWSRGPLASLRGHGVRAC